MTGEIKTKLETLTAEDPLGRTGDDDPWRDFRDIELLDFNLAFQFRHSLGKTSRFFQELENRRLMATKCPTCGKVWMPPRPLCPDDHAITEWVELPGTGTVAVATSSAYTLTSQGGDVALVVGYVTLDGASTALFGQIRNAGDPDELTEGTPMKVVWTDDPVDHPMQLFWFEPA